MSLPPRDPLRPSQERWDVIDEFLRALGPSSQPKKPPRWTAQEWNHLLFLRWRIERGEVQR